MFESGDKIVSLITDRNLTKDKIYTVKEFRNHIINPILEIDSDNYIRVWYSTKYFMSLLVYRKQKINKIKERIKNVVI